MGIADEGEKLCGDRQFEAQPVVEGLLQAPGGFAEILEADHAAAALEGVKAAPDGGEHLHVVGGFLQQRQVAGDGGPNVDRFLNEDGQQFGVDFFGAGIQQAAGFGGQHRCLGGGDRLGIAEQFAGIEHGEGLAGLLFEFDVGGQGGVLAQPFQVELEFGAQAEVVRIVLEGGGEGDGIALLLGQFGFDAGGRRGLLGGFRTQDALQVGGAVLEGVDVHAEG